MKVLLLQDVRGVGKRMEVKNVSDGYARNFLISRKLAVVADEASLNLKMQADAREQMALSKYKNLAAKLADEVFEFSVKTGESGEVFGSVKKETIKKAIHEKGYGNVEVILDQPLKTLGEHRVEINFGRGIREKARIILRASGVTLLPQHLPR